MIFVEMNASEFCQKFKITPREHPCPGCGKLITPSIPWISKDRVGLNSKCECGRNNGCPSTSIITNPEMAKRFKELITGIIGALKC